MLKQRKYDIVIFDLDGTLINTSLGLIDSMLFTISNLGLDSISEKNIMNYISAPADEFFMSYYCMSPMLAKNASNIFRTHYKKHNIYNAVPFGGIPLLLKQLNNAGYKIGVASYKREDLVISILRHFNIAQMCHAICGLDNDSILTKKDIINKALKKLGFSDNSKAVMIGDSHYDAIGAYESNIDFLAVTYGFDFKFSKDIDKYHNIGCVSSVPDLMNFFI